MGEPLPLSTLLSHVLVAFTIEADNELERQMLHRTTRRGAQKSSEHAPWLVSTVMWMNCMRFVGDEGISVRELERRSRTQTNLAGMERWGYVTVEPDPADGRLRPPRSAWIVRPTIAGRKAQEVWRPLFGEIEKRWQERLGKTEIGRLREELRAVAGQLELELPDCLPIQGYGLFSRGDFERRTVDEREDNAHLPLPALLSRVLLAFAVEFEGESELSLSICANVVRVLDEEGVRVRDLPLLSGVSKEGISMAMGILRKGRLAVVEAGPGCSRAKIIRLTSKGSEARKAYVQSLAEIEARWRARLGKDTERKLRESLERLAGEPTAQRSPLFLGLEPPPGGWRASVAKPITLPHFPMVLHRGGFPDGS